jgi:hypothetical protein
MSASVPPGIIALLNKVEPGYVVFAHCIYFRVRVIASENFKTFRVEQLRLTSKDRLDPKGAWSTVSTHGSETEGVMCAPAMEAMFEVQKRLARQKAAKNKALKERMM